MRNVSALIKTRYYTDVNLYARELNYWAIENTLSELTPTKCT